jgi:SAM-dependent methyltransferase
VLSDSKHNPLGRFDGLAGVYAKYRPSYPAEAIEWIIERLPDRRGTIVDVGCGTGISTRQLAGPGISVIGVEPNESMRAEAEQTPSSGIVYRAGQGEATGLGAGVADAVVAAQAFHWFKGPAALEEFHRILRPGGWISLMWNDADRTDDVTDAFWAIMRQDSPEPEVLRIPHHRSAEILLTHPQFDSALMRTTPNVQELDEEGLLGRAFSASFAPRECHAAQRFADRLRELFSAHSKDGKVRLVYRTAVYQARAH